MFAKELVIEWGDDNKVTIPDLPDEIVSLVESNMSEVVNALNENEITQAQFDEVINSGEIDKIKEEYDKIKENLGSDLENEFAPFYRKDSILVLV